MKEVEKVYDIGVVIGRFQVAALHKAHKEIIIHAMSKHKNYIVFIGVSPTLGTKDHPLDYTTRLKMIKEEYPDAVVLPIMDTASDSDWSKNIDTLIRATFPMGSVVLYGGRGSFIPSYSGIFPTIELEGLGEVAGQKIRENTGKEIRSTEDFRAGIIYSTQNQYPKTFMTVDIAVVDCDQAGFKVLLGRRTKESPLRFIGGFVDPSDTCLEEAAKRELYEEAKITSESDMEYLGSYLIKDWRYKRPDERIMTAFFLTEFSFGKYEFDKTEFSEMNWYRIGQETLEDVAPSHKCLFERLMLRMKGLKANKRRSPK